MKKYIITFITVFTIIASCQKDDFCIDPITPNLIIRFYDNDNPTKYKAPTSLSVWADGLGTIYKNISSDSILIPLDPNADFTLYFFKNGDFKDSFIINYTRKEVFVSRSCGYKYNFENINLTEVSNNWIKNTKITNETVENETKEHLKILH